MKVDYYLALRRSQGTLKKKHEDISPWILFILHMFAEQGEMSMELTKKDQIEYLLSRKQAAVWDIFQSGEKLSRTDISKKTNVNIHTVDQVLKKLLEHKKIVRIGEGRAIQYVKITPLESFAQ